MAEALRRTKKEALEQAKGDVIQLIQEKKCHPILIRYTCGFSPASVCKVGTIGFVNHHHAFSNLCCDAIG